MIINIEMQKRDERGAVRARTYNRPMNSTINVIPKKLTTVLFIP